MQSPDNRWPGEADPKCWRLELLPFTGGLSREAEIARLTPWPRHWVLRDERYPPFQDDQFHQVGKKTQSSCHHLLWGRDVKSIVRLMNGSRTR